MWWTAYAACETAVGHFEGQGYRAMRVCRALGFPDASAKQSMSFEDFQRLIERKQVVKHIPPGTFAVAPLDHYLEHRGFDVQASQSELRMARAYLVDDKRYTESERLAGLGDRRGFAAMYAVFKVGGFGGSTDRGSMSRREFGERCRLLNLKTGGV